MTGKKDQIAGFLVNDGIIQRLFNSPEEAREVAEQDQISTMDRPGHCVIPPFADAHAHLKFLGESLREPDLSSCTSFEDIRNKLVNWVRNASLSGGDMVHGRGWNPDQLTEQRWPHHTDLAHPDLSRHPVALVSHDHHAYWVNETFLGELHSNKRFPSDSAGGMHTDQQGNPTGVFVESAIEPVTDLVERKREDWSVSALIRNAMDVLLKNGITCVHDFGGYESLKAHQQLQTSTDRLPTVCFFCFQGSWDRIPSELRTPGRVTEGLEFAGLKLFADGTLGTQTAALLDPYKDQSDHSSPRGELVNKPEELINCARNAAEYGFSTAIHAIGDRAVKTSLNVLSIVYDGSNPLDYPPRIEHAQLVDSEDIDRFRTHGIFSSMQPCHLFQDRSLARKILGERTERLFPVQSLLDQEASILFGSDAPIEPPDPLRNLQSAVYRNEKENSTSDTDESISRKDALKLTCRTPRSYLNYSRNRGMITSGSPADFVVLSDDPLSYSSGPLTDIRVLETFINGQRVYSC